MGPFPFLSHTVCQLFEKYPTLQKKKKCPNDNQSSKQVKKNQEVRN